MADGIRVEVSVKCDVADISMRLTREQLIAFLEGIANVLAAGKPEHRS